MTSDLWLLTLRILASGMDVVFTMGYAWNAGIVHMTS